jgi:predicted permease
MTTLTQPVEFPSAEERAALPPRRVLGDIAILAQRNLRRLLRNTGLIVFSTLQPLLQLILFAYVFTSVVNLGEGISYKEFVVPAVLIQSMTFSAMGSGVGIAYDLQSGMIDRFRVLPIASSAARQVTASGSASSRSCSWRRRSSSASASRPGSGAPSAWSS